MGIVRRFTIRKGLKLPISGEPDQRISQRRSAKTVALLGRDYVGMKPTMLVKPGDKVSLGQPLFEDKKNPGVLYTSPAAGRVASVNRGEKRAFLSVVVSREGHSAAQFEHFPASRFESVGADKVRRVLVDSGMWTALRTRPFSTVPAVDAGTSSIFVSALDTNPLAADPALVIGEHQEDFQNGLRALTVLATSKVVVSSAPGSDVAIPEHPKIDAFEFQGPHPAGLVGTHIHFIDPVGEKKTVWHVGYQDVIAIGKLLTTGSLWTERVVSLAGPMVREPRLIRAQLGGCLADVVEGELEEGESRLVSGSVFAGDLAGASPQNYLGRYHTQISVIREDRSRVLLGWQGPGFDTFSTKNVFLSKLRFGRKFDFSTNTNGSKRAMVPIGMYEGVMPLDIFPTYLLRALVSQDLEGSVSLGALELDEEDLGLCSFVCPGKTEYGPLLRQLLTRVAKEG
jgi:Na+-transporting NADH:ubiquinone oxidoreductase subunit A